MIKNIVSNAIIPMSNTKIKHTSNHKVDTQGNINEVINHKVDTQGNINEVITLILPCVSTL
jgi:hypothetical protein